MATIKPFRSVRPAPMHAAEIAALPYDVYSREEARAFVKTHPLSFLKIDRAETLLPEYTELYSSEVYDKARTTLNEMIEQSYFIQDPNPCYYVYELTLNGASQTGLVGCTAIDDYLNGTVKKHENTRADKELDRICHIDTMDAQTGPIFLAYRHNAQLADIFAAAKQNKVLYDFISEDNVRHRVWMISGPAPIQAIEQILDSVSSIYIADGHHRAASAVKVGLKRREQASDYTGKEEFNYFLSVLFPDDELHILPYNRMIRDLNGYTVAKFIEALTPYFTITEQGQEPFAPTARHTFGMYLDRKWYALSAKESIIDKDIVKQLDVSILQDVILSPLLGIKDPKTDIRIRFIGGSRGLKGLMAEADTLPESVAFCMYPTAMDELLQVADAGKLMPPKSTWFEPKLYSGLFIHQI